MSASPAGPPSGPPSTTPNGGPAPGLRRKKPAGGPFAAKFKSTNRPPPARTVPPKPLNGTKPAPSAARPTPAPAATTQALEPDDDPSLYTEYPLVTTKRALLEGLRHHVMRFTAPDREVNPYLATEDQFQRPVRLQRRFPHDTPKDPLPNATENPEDDKEREKEAIRKAERVAEREANQAQIAPTDKTAAAKKRQPFKKKTEDVYFPTDTPEAQKRAKLRYEEGRPWHLEDFSGKNSWVGTYEEPLSETHAMFALDAKGSFRVVPLEKWYRFAPTARYTTMNLDEAEMHMSKKMKQPRFYGEVGARAEEKNKAEDDRRKRLQETGRVGMRGENQRIKGEDDEQKMDLANDVDEIDFEGAEEFQDDDENPLFAEDDDGREAERKIKEERHEANIFAGTGVKEDKDWDAEEEREQKRLKEERKLSKKLRKNLMKREKKFEYDSESDHPYSESVCPYPKTTLSPPSNPLPRATPKIQTKSVLEKKRSARRKKRKPRQTATSCPRAPHPKAQTPPQAARKSKPQTPSATNPQSQTSNDQARPTSPKPAAANPHTSASRRSTANATCPAPSPVSLPLAPCNRRTTPR